MGLSQRLQKIADIVLSLHPKCVCDVGTDHAYIPIYCVRNGVSKAIASDVREGPLKIARENIEKAGLSSLVSTILSDGLDEMHQGDADVVIISGMGGENIAGILEKARWENTTFVLGPQSKLERLRTRMDAAGYRVVEEVEVEEKEKKYIIIITVLGEKTKPLQGDSPFSLGREV